MVLLLFKFVTSYGKNNLKAASAIGGEYLIDHQYLPDCFSENPVNLKIDQSGIYLFATLTQQPSLEADLDLNGFLKDQELSLKGKIPVPESCANQSPGSKFWEVRIQGRVQGQKLIGQINWLSLNQTLELMANRVEPSNTEPINH